MRVIKAAAVQISPVLCSQERTVEKVARKIHELGQQGVQSATFPKTVVPCYPYFSVIKTPPQDLAGTEHLKLLDQAVTVPSPATGAIGKATRKAGGVVSIGVNERDGGVGHEDVGDAANGGARFSVVSKETHDAV
jgi:aliphatic nitrilase